MQKLHLVGFTTDQNGLILSARRGARSGGYTLVLDDALAVAVEEMRARQEEEAEAAGPGGANRTESRLPIGEIQTRLRRGRSLKDVAKDAGVEPEWVERFAAPVFAEQAGVISRVQGTFYKRQRLGPSGMRIGDAVRRNLAERGVVMSPAEYADAWRTFQRPDGRWIVQFTFHHRGANKTLKFEVRPNGDVVGADPLTSQMAYVTPPKRTAPRPRPAPAPPSADDGSAKRAVVSSGFRPDPVVKAASRPGKERERAAAAMTKAAQRRAAEGERNAARKARERDQLLARQAREAAAEAQRRERELATKAREAAAAARLAAAEQAERQRAAAAVSAAKQAERDAARRAARLKVKAESKAVVAKRAAAGRADQAATAKAAAVVRATDRPRPGSAEPAKRPPRPSAAARVDLPPPSRAAATAPTRATKAPAKAGPKPTARATGRPERVPEAAQPRPSTGELARQVRSEEPARPQFRAELATPATDEPTAALPRSNGAAPERPPGARRRRQLRAN